MKDNWLCICWLFSYTYSFKQNYLQILTGLLQKINVHSLFLFFWVLLVFFFTMVAHKQKEGYQWHKSVFRVTKKQHLIHFISTGFQRLTLQTYCKPLKKLHRMYIARTSKLTQHFWTSNIIYSVFWHLYYYYQILIAKGFWILHKPKFSHLLLFFSYFRVPYPVKKGWNNSMNGTIMK